MLLRFNGTFEVVQCFFDVVGSGFEFPVRFDVEFFDVLIVRLVGGVAEVVDSSDIVGEAAESVVGCFCCGVGADAEI